MPPRKRKTTKRTTTTRKPCRTSKRKTNGFLQGALKASSAVNSAIDAGIKRQQRVAYMNNMLRGVGKGVRWLFGMRYNTKKIGEQLKDMKIKLLKHEIKQTDPIFKQMREMKELLRNINWARKQGYDDMEDYHTEKAKRLYNKIAKKYYKLVDN